MLTPVGVVVRLLHLFLGTALWGVLLVLVEAYCILLPNAPIMFWRAELSVDFSRLLEAQGLQHPQCRFPVLKRFFVKHDAAHSM